MLSTAKDGQKVVDNILSEEPDVVLMDIFMPQLDALEVMQKISELGLFPNGLSLW